MVWAYLSATSGITTRLKNGQIQSGLEDGEDILEYNGKGVKNKVADCTGFCRGVLPCIPSFAPLISLQPNQG
jgi:hypothetical protein